MNDKTRLEDHREKKEKEHEDHVVNVLSTCKRLNCSPFELLQMDYRKELSV